MSRMMLSILVSVGLAITPAMARATASSRESGSTVAESTAAADPGRATEPTTDPRVVRLQRIYADAQARVQRYDQQGAPSDLQAARDGLATWLADHHTLYGDTPAARQVRASVQQQLDSIDARIAARSAPPPPRTVAPPSPAGDVAHHAGSGLIHGGTALLVVGGASVLGVALPLVAVRDRALDRAASAQFRVEQQADLDRARRRHTGAMAMFVVGGSLAAAGLSMLVVGGTQRARARRLSMTPQLGPGFAGASATLRF
ncbi:MAG: hypothetical protein AAGF11_29090 [Myxococcota bacterium]